MGTIKRNFYNNITPTGKFDSADLTGTIPADNIANASLNNVTSVPASVGDFVQKVASDPTPVGAGDVWYNTTSNALKSVVSSEAWSSGAPLTTVVFYNTGAGLQTAALSFGGTSSAPGTAATQTEEYNGSGWSIGGALPSGRVTSAGAGTQTAGLNAGGGNAFPGTAQTTSEEYDGTSWTAGGSLSTGRRYTAGCGTQTAAIVNGGQNPGGTTISDTEEYDGSTWTSGGAWPKAIRQHVLLGSQTATLGSGGYSTTTEVEAYEYNGSTWTATGDMNQQRYVFQGFGTQTQGVVCGGEPTPSAGTLTETYDGSTFSTSPASLGNSTAQAGYGKSPGTAGLVFGNASGGTTGATEEYNVSSNIITAAAWASGGNMNTARRNFRGSGTQTAALAAGGQSGTPPLPDSESYDGSSWSATPSLGTARSSLGMGTSAPSTAAVAFGGYLGPPYPNMSVATEEYNGSSWTASGNLTTGRYGMYGFGTQTAAVSAGGDANPVVTSVEEYNGSTWTAGTALGSSRYAGASCGLLTAGLIFGGSSPITVSTEEYDGSSWTTGGNLNSAVGNSRGAGIQTSALSMGGQRPSVTSATEQYNGTSWVTSASMATARSGMAEAGTSSAALIGAGNPGSSPYNTAATEEFTGETSAANIVEITTS